MNRDFGYIRSVNLIGLQEFLGVEKSWLQLQLKEVGIPVEALDNFEMLISFNGFCLLHERLARLVNRPSLGIDLSIAAAPNFAFLGPMSALADFVSTAEEFFDIAMRYWSFHSNAFKLIMLHGDAETPSIMRLVGHSYILPSRQFAEGYTANAVGLARSIFHKPELNPVVMRFQHSRPDDFRRAAEYFNSPVEYNCEHTEIVFPTEFLKLRTKGRFWFLKPLLGFHIKRRIERTVGYDQSAAGTVALAIPSLLGSSKCNIENIAESLGLTTKQLQRQLEREQTNFSDILQQVRQSLACQMLIETNVAISNIAGLLDYAGNPPFTLAFERWTGMTPSVYRKAERKRLGLEM